ncbi:ANTAR domain-containing protein [Streptomyces sp. NPDC046465]|uniref:ANTAR domain-containing protein n=1 Tax=Streptomyces sp. NPDC046465 TaxID=3155810 RepID=UPI0033F6354E
MRDRDSELRLADVLVKTADTLTDDFDAEEYLRWLSDCSVELLDAQGAGIMYTGGNDGVRLISNSGQEGCVRDLLAVQHRGGPCVESFGTGRPVPPVGLDEAKARWPAFGAQALKYGVAQTYAVPMRRHDTILGALNVFVPVAHQSTACEREFRVALVLAHGAAVGLGNHLMHAEYRTLSEQLQTALDSRIRVEQAKGFLAQRWGTDVDEAFEALRRYARNEQQAIDLVAGQVIKGSIGDAALRDGGSAPR